MLNWRNVECHEYSAGGCLKAEKHFDAGSLITMDVMLAAPGLDFKGGAFVAPQLDVSFVEPDFWQGDAVFFYRTRWVIFQ